MLPGSKQDAAHLRLKASPVTLLGLHPLLGPSSSFSPRLSHSFLDRDREEVAVLCSPCRQGFSGGLLTWPCLSLPPLSVLSLHRGQPEECLAIRSV